MGPKCAVWVEDETYSLKTVEVYVPHSETLDREEAHQMAFLDPRVLGHREVFHEIKDDMANGRFIVDVHIAIPLLPKDHEGHCGMIQS